MSKVRTVYWSDLIFKYAPNNNYHGTCYYSALKMLLKEDFKDIFKDCFTPEIIKNHSTNLNSVNPLSNWVYNNKNYRFVDKNESLHDEEGIIWLKGEGGQSHVMYFKNGYYYDDYMSLDFLKNPTPLLIMAKVITK